MKQFFKALAQVPRLVHIEEGRADGCHCQPEQPVRTTISDRWHVHKRHSPLKMLKVEAYTHIDDDCTGKVLTGKEWEHAIIQAGLAETIVNRFVDLRWHLGCVTGACWGRDL